MATRGIVWLDGLQARKAVVASARGMRSVVLIYGRYCLGATAPNGSALVCPGVSLAPGTFLRSLQSWSRELLAYQAVRSRTLIVRRILELAFAAIS